MDERDDRKEIDPKEFECDAFRVWGDDWLVLAAGDYSAGKFNAMTVGWGFFGTLWAEPAVMVMLRPQRYTLEFLDSCATFTLSAFPEQYRSAMAEIGKVSGREVPDKLLRAGLTAVESAKVEAPSFAEAELVLECRKTYRSTLSAKNFIDKRYINAMYPDRDFHVCFFGEVLRIAGSDKYRKAHTIHE